MTFTLPSVTAILVLSLVAAAIGALTVAAVAGTFLVRNHRVRVARAASIPTYYRELAFSH